MPLPKFSSLSNTYSKAIGNPISPDLNSCPLTCGKFYLGKPLQFDYSVLSDDNWENTICENASECGKLLYPNNRSVDPNDFGVTAGGLVTGGRNLCGAPNGPPLPIVSWPYEYSCENPERWNTAQCTQPRMWAGARCNSVRPNPILRN
jgi:hypothetical protein